MKPHSLMLVMIGASLLWVGWFGFNAGSALAANGTAGMSLLATHLASCAAALVYVTMEWMRYGKPSALGIVTGSLAGLVAITPACGLVGPLGAIAIGGIAAVASFVAVNALKRRFGYDDTLDVFGVHGVSGLVGTLLTGVFAARWLGGDRDLASILDQVLAQVKAIAVTIAVSGVGTAAILFAIDRTLGLRAPAGDEATGLDLTEHGEAAYNY